MFSKLTRSVISAHRECVPAESQGPAELRVRRPRGPGVRAARAPSPGVPALPAPHARVLTPDPHPHSQSSVTHRECVPAEPQSSWPCSSGATCPRTRCFRITYPAPHARVPPPQLVTSNVSVTSIPNYILCLLLFVFYSSLPSAQQAKLVLRELQL